jgi:hypothetical protein
MTGMTFCRGRRPAASAGLLGLLFGLAAGGCGSGAPYAESSQTEATVSGRVTAQGKPVTKGQVIFDPANVNRKTVPARTAEIRKDGTYEVTTLIGANRVTVAIPGRLAKAGFPYVQQIYEVQSGSHTFDIAIP